MIVDMLCHWRYVIDNLFGEVKSVSCLGATHIPERIDEQGNAFACDTDDSCYATIELKNGIICHFNCSWNTRVRRDDLLTVHVDGTKGSAVVGLREVLDPAQRQHAQAGVEPRHRQPDRFLRWLAEGPGLRALRQRLQDPVGRLHPPRCARRRPVGP